MVLWAVTYCFELSEPSGSETASDRILCLRLLRSYPPRKLSRSWRLAPWQSPLSKPYHPYFRAESTLFRRVRKVFYYLVLGFASTFLQFCLYFQIFLSSSGSKTYLLLQNLHTVSTGLPSFVISSMSFLPRAASPDSILSLLQLHLNSTS